MEFMYRKYSRNKNNMKGQCFALSPAKNGAVNLKDEKNGVRRQNSACGITLEI